MKHKTKIKQSGFTIIEAVLYLAIVAIVLVAAVEFHLTMGSTASKLSSNITTSQNRRAAMSSIDFLVRNSDGFLKDLNGHCSNLAASPPVLALYFKSDTYLPGSCVASGGGVRITVDDRQVKMTCYPNIYYNGGWRTCDTGIYTPSTTFELTSPEVVVHDAGLVFSTSTATSTNVSFPNITTNLSVGMLSHEQVSLAATSTASSTIVMRNEQPDGLVAYWKFDDAAGSAALDSSGRGNDMTCTGSPTPVSGLVTSSTGAFDFNSATSDRCNASNPDDLNFTGPFTIAAWLKTDYVADGQDNIITKAAWTGYWGYAWTAYTTGGVSDSRLWLRILGNNTYSNTADTTTYDLTNATVYHITHIYDPDNDQARLYIYEKGVGAHATTTKNGVPTLVNYHSNDLYVSSYFDGTIDELRLYNRALSDEEVWALQSQGM